MSKKKDLITSALNLIGDILDNKRHSTHARYTYSLALCSLIEDFGEDTAFMEDARLIMQSLRTLEETEDTLYRTCRRLHENLQRETYKER